MSLYYFNTNPLLRWAESRAPEADSRSSNIGAAVERLMGDDENRNALSEVTLAEFQSNLCVYERMTEKAHLDAVWCDECLRGIMTWIAEGKLKVLDTPPKLIEKAMAYVRFATRERGLALRAWDAAHLYEASYWARSEGVPVLFVTTDPHFRKTFEAFPEFTEFVSLYDPELRSIFPAQDKPDSNGTGFPTAPQGPG